MTKSRVLLSLLAGGMALSLTACGKNEAPTPVAQEKKVAAPAEAPKDTPPAVVAPAPAKPQKPKPATYDPKLVPAPGAVVIKLDAGK